MKFVKLEMILYLTGGERSLTLILSIIHGAEKNVLSLLKAKNIRVLCCIVINGIQ